MSETDTRTDPDAILHNEEETAPGANQNYFPDFEESDDIAIPEEDQELPDFPFDQPRTITLKGGTVHKFNVPTPSQERIQQGLQRTIIITSPAIVNGQNPRQIKTDYSKSRIAYYQLIINAVKGYAFNEGDDPTVELDAQKVIREEPIEGTDKIRKIKLASLVPITHQRAAVERVYGGKIEIVKPKLKEGEKEIVVLNTRRFMEVMQELGIEQNDDGTFTVPEFRLKYRFVEAGSKHLSDWETKCFGGFVLNNPKGGTKEERTYNVDACVHLFDSMIDSIEGGSVGGVAVDAKNSEHLAKIPEAIKVTIISFVMHDVTSSSGN